MAALGFLLEEDATFSANRETRSSQRATFPKSALSKLIPLGDSASIEFGVQARRIRAFFTEDGVTYRIGTRSSG